MTHQEQNPSEPDQVTEIGPTHRGRWLVTTLGSRHIWDLDAMTYQRLPGAESGRFAYDETELPILQVDRWPAVGRSSVVWFDDPSSRLLEHWRVSSTIQRIERIDTDPEE